MAKIIFTREVKKKKMERIPAAKSTVLIIIHARETVVFSVRQAAGLKKHKDKVAIEKGKIGTPKTQNNNLIIADRNELLKQFMDIEDE